jgi:integrase
MLSMSLDQQIVLSGQSYTNFVNALRSPITRIVYDNVLKRFMKFCNVNHPDLMLQKDPRMIQAMIIDWITSLRDPPRSLSYSTLNIHRSAIVTFFQMNDVVLNSKRIGRYQGERQRQFKDRAYTRKEIQKLLEISDERMKVVILLFASCGLRPGALPDLKLRHLHYIEEYSLYKITIYEGHEKEYYTFCTPECSKAIISYLEYRQLWGEHISDDSPLIRMQFDRNDIYQVRNPRPLKLRGINQLLDQILYKSGLHKLEPRTEDHTKDKRKDTARATGFRKFVITNMAEAGVDFEIRESLVGHSLGLSGHYLRHSEQTTIMEYLKAVDSLTINEENRLKRKVKILTMQVDKINEMEERINLLNKKLGLD